MRNKRFLTLSAKVYRCSVLPPWGLRYRASAKYIRAKREASSFLLPTRAASIDLCVEGGFLASGDPEIIDKRNSSNYYF